MKNILVLLVSLSFLSCKSQSKNESIVIYNNSFDYYIGNTHINMEKFTIKNQSKNNYWFWFSETEKTSKSDNLIIKEHFYKIRGDFSLYHIAVDANVGNYVPDVLTGFIKCLKPNDTFIIYIYNTEGDLYKKNDWLAKHLIYYEENYLSKILPSIRSFTNITLYKENYIILPYELIK